MDQRSPCRRANATHGWRWRSASVGRCRQRPVSAYDVQVRRGPASSARCAWCCAASSTATTSPMWARARHADILLGEIGCPARAWPACGQHAIALRTDLLAGARPADCGLAQLARPRDGAQRAVVANGLRTGIGVSARRRSSRSTTSTPSSTAARSRSVSGFRAPCLQQLRPWSIAPGRRSRSGRTPCAEGTARRSCGWRSRARGQSTARLFPWPLGRSPQRRGGARRTMPQTTPAARRVSSASVALKSCVAIVARARWLVIRPRASARGTPALRHSNGIRRRLRYCVRNRLAVAEEEVNTVAVPDPGRTYVIRALCLATQMRAAQEQTRATRRLEHAGVDAATSRTQYELAGVSSHTARPRRAAERELRRRTNLPPRWRRLAGVGLAISTGLEATETERLRKRDQPAGRATLVGARRCQLSLVTRTGQPRSQMTIRCASSGIRSHRSEPGHATEYGNVRPKAGGSFAADSP
jgi:hypothetical protein